VKKLLKEIEKGLKWTSLLVTQNIFSKLL
jgi:hypothetical protein